MKVPTPHFLLFSESSRKQRQGQWRFLLKSVDGADQLEAADAEPDVHGERLELLAVIRGLEALDQPSRVTLVTPSKYVHRGLLYGLNEWRSNGWSWEHFGQMVPVKNRDLWQRLDRALGFHALEFQPWRLDLPAADDEGRTAVDATGPLGESEAGGIADGGSIQQQGVRPARGRVWQGGPLRLLFLRGLAALRNEWRWWISLYGRRRTLLTHFE